MSNNCVCMQNCWNMLGLKKHTLWITGASHCIQYYISLFTSSFIIIWNFVANFFFCPFSLNVSCPAPSEEFMGSWFIYAHFVSFLSFSSFSHGHTPSIYVGQCMCIDIFSVYRSRGSRIGDLPRNRLSHFYGLQKWSSRAVYPSLWLGLQP